MLIKMGGEGEGADLKHFSPDRLSLGEDKSRITNKAICCICYTYTKRGTLLSDLASC